MLSPEAVAEVFEEILGRRPGSGVWIAHAARRHNTRKSLATELMASAEFQSTQTQRDAIFRKMFRPAAIQSLPAEDKRETYSTLVEQLNKIKKLQGNYHPIYDLGAEYEQSPRLENLIFNCEIIRAEFSQVLRKDQVRILDVGCNLGYVSFNLAAAGFNAVGVDIDPANIRFCQTLARYNGSSARFEAMDFFGVAESRDADWENLDCLLLLNVVHQLIFSQGLHYATMMLGRLAKRVDVVFIELARKAEYMSHGKDHLLPDDPAAVLSACRDCEVKLIKHHGRPLYRVSRLTSRVGFLYVQPKKISFSESAAHGISRKYYKGNGRFLKLLRFTDSQTRQPYDGEVSGLLALQGTGLAPTIIDWFATPTFGALLMEKIEGAELRTCLTKFSRGSKLYRFIEQYLSIGAALAQRKLYHNDLAPHNIFVLSDSSLCATDFDQTDTTCYIDPFAVMLWTVFDIIAGQDESYRRQIYPKLHDPGGITRASLTFYPNFSGFELDEFLKDFIDRALTNNSWFDFVEAEASVFSEHINKEDKG
jgi:SAM-dependent methyltransferase